MRARDRYTGSVSLMVAATTFMLGCAFVLQALLFSHGGHGALSDLPRVFLHRKVSPGAPPYLDRMLEYPVLAGALLYLATLIWPTALGVLVVTAVAATACAEAVPARGRSGPRRDPLARGST